MDEKLAREEAENQMNSMQNMQNEADRTEKSIKTAQKTAFKNLERESEEKDHIIMGLKSQLKENEINAMNNENILRDELDLLKDKNSKLLQAQATLEVYKERLKEIPELKVKLSQALKQNLQFENQKNEQLRLETEKSEL